MIVRTPAVLGVLHACVLYFCICTWSAQLSMFYMERRSRNTLIIVVIVLSFIIIVVVVIMWTHLPRITRCVVSEALRTPQPK